MRIRPALAGAAVGAATMTLSALLAMPAFAAPITQECLAAENNLSTVRGQLVQAQGQLAADRAAGAALSVIQHDQQVISNYQAQLTVAQAQVTALCGTTGGGNGLPFPRPIPNPGPVGFPNGGYLNCAQLAALGYSNIPAGTRYYYAANDADHDGIACETGGTGIPVGTYPVGAIQVVNGVKCSYNGTAWVPVTQIPAGTVWTVNGQHCNWNGTAWVPVPPTTVDPNCDCTNPAPTNIVVRPAPQVTQTVVQQAPAPQIVVDSQPVVVPPAQVFSSPIAPSIGAVATGDGSVFGR